VNCIGVRLMAIINNIGVITEFVASTALILLLAYAATPAAPRAGGSLRGRDPAERVTRPGDRGVRCRKVRGEGSQVAADTTENRLAESPIGRARGQLQMRRFSQLSSAS
jgi:hypothetical protein